MEIRNISELNGAELRNLVENAKGQYLRGEIAYETAVEIVEELLPRINELGRAVAKRHKKNYHNLTVGYLLR